MDKGLRRCRIKGGDYGYFHGIYPWSDVVGPSFAVGGHPGGTVARPVAVVELMDGTLRMEEISNVVLFVPGSGAREGKSPDGAAGLGGNGNG